MREQNSDKFDDADWHASSCPFCGYYSDISKIIEARYNVRILHCGFCENEWKYPRLNCAICENNDQDTLGFFTYDDDNVYRIDFCDVCKGFIKTIRIPEKYTELGSYVPFM